MTWPYLVVGIAIMAFGLFGIGCMIRAVWKARRPVAPKQVSLPDGRMMNEDLVQIVGTHHWGESVRVQYDPDKYEGELSCLTCERPILRRQWFWETPLLDSGGLSFQTCLSCQPGDVEAVAGDQ